MVGYLGNGKIKQPVFIKAVYAGLTISELNNIIKTYSFHNPHFTLDIERVYTKQEGADFSVVRYNVLVIACDQKPTINDIIAEFKKLLIYKPKR